MFTISTIQAEGDPGFLHSIVANIPFDAAAILIYALLAGSVWLIWWANRNAGRSRKGTSEGPPEEKPQSRGGAA